MRANAITCYIVLGCLLSGSALALDPSRSLTQYGHTAWRVREGYFSAPPLAIAQTRDGQLWLGGEGGLLRFDGVQFSPWKPTGGQALPDERIYGLLGASDGSLWIGTGSGLAQWKNDKLTVYAKAGRFSSLLEDRLGTIWAGHTRAVSVVPPLCHFANSEFNCFAFSDPKARSWVGALGEDHNGDLWIATAGAVCQRRSAGEVNCFVIPTSKPSEAGGGIQYMAIDSDDVIWLDGGTTGIWQLKSGQWRRYGEFPQLKLRLRSSFVDRESGLWLGDQNHGLIRHIGGRVERFDRTDGLSGDTVTAMFEDREGSVWAATSHGLDRFRDVKVATITSREGLPISNVGSIVASKDGGLWIAGVAGSSKLIHVKIDRAPSYELVRGYAENGEFGSVFEDSVGRLWLGVGHVLIWREKGQFHKVPSFVLHEVGERVRAISEDTQGNIWAATTDPQFALVCIRDGQVRERFTRQELGDQVSAMAADAKGGMWFSRAVTPGLMLARNGTFELQADEFPGSAGNMFFDSHGLWASTRKGAVHYDNGIVKILSTKNGLACDDLDAAIEDDRGALWVKGTCGLTQIAASELELWLKDPTRHIQIRNLDAFDGTQAGKSSFAHVTKTSDGRIWFALEEVGVQVVDPQRVQHNPIPPSVAVTSLVADHRLYGLTPQLRLPALTRDFEIDYTAYSLMVPEKVKFRYRLDGFDKSWQDVGFRRQAYFGNLKPGRYRFNVSASNNDGVWNEQPASFDFSIAPAFYQTPWFLGLCAAAALGTLYMFFQLRLRQVAQHVRGRMEARVAERERIARDLHDTLLQSVQGLILKFDAAVKQMPSGEPARRAIEKTLDHADQVLAEGRDRVRSLRAGGIGFGQLPNAFQQVADEVSPNRSAGFKTVVEGSVLELHPIIREESYSIGREAIINALTHSEGHNIEVEITYDPRQFRLRVRDDGRGVDTGVLEKGGRAGHWGLQGMRERAGKIGGHLELWSRPGAGTEVALMVRGTTAYRRLPTKRKHFWAGWFSGLNGDRK